MTADHSIQPVSPQPAAPYVAVRAGVASVLRAAFDEARAAHVGIDIQHKYCASGYGDGPNDHEKEQRIAAKIGEFTAATRAAMAPVWVNHVNDNDRDWRVLPGEDTGLRARFMKLFRLHPYSEEDFARRDAFGTHVQPDDVVLAKPLFDGFAETRLDDVLRARGADTLVLTGFFMDQCVMETALTARNKGYEVVLAANLSRVGSEMNTGAALRKLRDHGVKIATSGTIITEARRWI